MPTDKTIRMEEGKRVSNTLADVQGSQGSNEGQEGGTRNRSVRQGNTKGAARAPAAPRIANGIQRFQEAPSVEAMSRVGAVPSCIEGHKWVVNKDRSNAEVTAYCCAVCGKNAGVRFAGKPVE
jgi:hypothetical protein